MEKIIDVHKYSLIDQRSFAKLSGDFNPLHLSPVNARRELTGDIIAHGIHSMLRALDAFAKILKDRGVKNMNLKKLSCQFPNAIYTNQKIKTYVIEERRNSFKLQAYNAGLLVTDMMVQWDAAIYKPRHKLSMAPPKKQNFTPCELSLDKIKNRQGKLNFYIDRKLLKLHFPYLGSLVPMHVLANILALSRLVGMECPGLRSILSSIDVRFRPLINADTTLKYNVKTVDERFSMLNMAVRSAAIYGTINAFLRPSPQKQPNISYIQNFVKPNEFSRQRALIIGGSRGLGEVTAKIIAAGGGHTVITYNRGIEDIQPIANEIRKRGVPCNVVQLDISRPIKAVKKIARFGFPLTHIYYFASPKIFVKKAASYDPHLFRKFADFYVDGLFKLYEACRDIWPQGLVLFYPSSVAVDEKVPDLAEYAAAKSAGETLCRQLGRFDKKLSVVIKRLPRIATDQTLTLLPYPAANAMETMLGIVRELNKKAGWEKTIQNQDLNRLR